MDEQERFFRRANKMSEQGEKLVKTNMLVFGLCAGALGLAMLICFGIFLLYVTSR